MLYATAARARGIPVLLHAGGENYPVGEALLKSFDYLCPNEGELAQLTGLPTEDETQVARLLQPVGTSRI